MVQVTLYPILKDFGILSDDDWNNWGKKNGESILRVFGKKTSFTSP